MIYIRHIRSCGLCARGARDWFTANGLSWSDFLANGISAEALRATGSALCETAIAAAEAEAEHGK